MKTECSGLKKGLMAFFSVRYLCYGAVHISHLYADNIFYRENLFPYCTIQDCDFLYSIKEEF